MGLVYDRVGNLVRWAYDARITAPPVLDLDIYFPNASKFTSAWREIRDEALQLAAHLQSVPRFHELMQEQAAISANDGRDWRLFVLKAYGVEFPHNMAACPTLARLVAAAPDVLSAAISFLGPGKHIPAHRGPFRGVLRFYLVLSMPLLDDGKAAAVLRVADQEYRIAEGDCLLWDDTYEHEVWNSSDRLRTVLLLDVQRRGMPLDLQLLSRFLIGMVGIGVRLRALN